MDAEGLPIAVAIAGAGTKMGDYSDFLRKYASWVPGVEAAAKSMDWFNQTFDDSHGKKRYYLSNTPWGLIRRLEDKGQREQDRWDNTQQDNTYSDTIDNSLAGYGTGLASGMAHGAMRMARSLAGVYGSEVVEDVTQNIKKHNYMYG